MDSIVMPCSGPASRIPRGFRVVDLDPLEQLLGDFLILDDDLLAVRLLQLQAVVDQLRQELLGQLVVAEAGGAALPILGAVGRRMDSAARSA